MITTANLHRAFFALLAGTLAFRLWLSHVLPMTGDEAYFYYWGAVPDWGFYDHPPMVGWWLGALQSVSNAPAWLRLPSTLLPAVMAGSLLWFLKPRGEQIALSVASLVLLAPANVWNVAITTDTALVYFSFFSALCFLRACRDDAPRWYLAAGVLLGGAFLSKYFAVLLGLAYAATLLWRPSRAKLVGLLLVVAGAMPFVVLNVWWNMGHCWANIMFNVFNRHGDAGWSWKTPLLYAATLAYLLTPLVAWRLWRGRLAWARLMQEPADRGLLMIGFLPLAVFALLSPVKSIGMHWLLSFVPFVLVVAVRVAGDAARAGLVKFFAGLAALHVLLVVVIANLPVDVWRNTRLYDGIILTVKSQELLAELRPYERDYVFMTEGYSPSVTLSFNAQRYFPVFGEGSSHARHDDILTDFRALDGRNVLVLVKGGAPDLARFAPYFRAVEIKPFAVRGAQYWMVLGQGFDYPSYRDKVLEKIRARWYAVPKWLPQTSCYFCDRYFPQQSCCAK